MFVEALSGGGGVGVVTSPIRVTGNDSPTGYHVTASSTYSNNYEPYMAFNGSASNNGWAPRTAGDGWVKVELPSAKRIAIAIMKYSASRTYTLYGSNDDSDYTELGTITTTTSLTDMFNNVSLVNSSAYKYFKVVGNFATAGAGYKVELYPIEEAS